MKYEKILKDICRQPILTEKTIEGFFKKNGIVNITITPKNIGRDGFEIQTDEGLSFVTERPVDFLNRKWGRVTATQQRMLDLQIPVPLFMGEGMIVEDVYKINKSADPYSESNKWLHDIFSIEVAVAYFNKFLSQSDSLKDYKAIIFEAIEAYYLGMDHIAIMALFPVFEAGLRNIQEKLSVGQAGNVSGEEFDRGLRRLIVKWGKSQFPEYSWHPGKGYNTAVEIDFFTHVNPQCDVMNAFRIFIADVLYKPSRADHGQNGFNRHLILHLLKNDFNESANFFRIFLTLTHITFIESLTNQKVPFFWQGFDTRDEEIGKYIRTTMDVLFSGRRSFLKHHSIFEY